MPSPSTNLSTGVSTKPTRLVPDYLSKTQNYLPLSVFFTGIPEEEAEPNSLFGFKMPDRTRKPAAAKTPKKNKGGDTSSEKDAKGKDDDKDEKAKGKGPQKGPQGPERSQTSKPRPAASVSSQVAQGGGEAPSGAKQESKGTMWKPQKCNYCDKVADKRIIWADGRAYHATCADHVKKGKATLKKKNGKWAEIVAVKTVKNMSEALSVLLFGAENWQLAASSEEGMTTTANVPTLPVPIGAGDGRKFLDSPDDDKRKRKRKRKRLSRSLYVLLRH